MLWKNKRALTVAHDRGPVADSSAEATKCGSRQRSSRSRLVAARLADCRRASVQVHARVTSCACGTEWSWAVVSGGGADESPERQREKEQLVGADTFSLLATSAVASLSPTLASTPSSRQYRVQCSWSSSLLQNTTNSLQRGRTRSHTRLGSPRHATPCPINAECWADESAE